MVDETDSIQNAIPEDVRTRTKAELIKRFSSVKTLEPVTHQVQTIQTMFREFALELYNLSPVNGSRELSIALTHLEKASMFAVKNHTHNTP